MTPDDIRQSRDALDTKGPMTVTFRRRPTLHKGKPESASLLMMTARQESRR